MYVCMYTLGHHRICKFFSSSSLQFKHIRVHLFVYKWAYLLRLLALNSQANRPKTKIQTRIPISLISLAQGVRIKLLAQLYISSCLWRDHIGLNQPIKNRCVTLSILYFCLLQKATINSHRSGRTDSVLYHEPTSGGM